MRFRDVVFNGVLWGATPEGIRRNLESLAKTPQHQVMLDGLAQKGWRCEQCSAPTELMLMNYQLEGCLQMCLHCIRAFRRRRR